MKYLLSGMREMPKIPDKQNFKNSLNRSPFKGKLLKQIN